MSENKALVIVILVISAAVLGPLAAMTSGPSGKSEAGIQEGAEEIVQGRFGAHFAKCVSCDRTMHEVFAEYLSLGPCNLPPGESCERGHLLTVHGERMTRYLTCCYRAIGKPVQAPPSHPELLEYIAQTGTYHAVEFVEECQTEEDDPAVRRFAWIAAARYLPRKEVAELVRRHYTWERSPQVREAMLAAAEVTTFGDEAPGGVGRGLGSHAREIHREWLREEALPFEEREGNAELLRRIEECLAARAPAIPQKKMDVSPHGGGVKP